MYFICRPAAVHIALFALRTAAVYIAIFICGPDSRVHVYRDLCIANGCRVYVYSQFYMKARQPCL